MGKVTRLSRRRFLGLAPALAWAWPGLGAGKGAVGASSGSTGDGGKRAVDRHASLGDGGKRGVDRDAALGVGGKRAGDRDVALGVGGWQEAGGPDGPFLGLQLYTVRDEMNRDAAGTLRQVKEIGYGQVEHAGYWKGKFYGYPARDFRKLLDGLGLRMPSGHVSLEAADYDGRARGFGDDWKRTVEDAAVMGQRFLITPGFPEAWLRDRETVLRYLEVFNRCGAFCKTFGIKFGYHNHTMEFEKRYPGPALYDLMLQHTDPSLVALQLDVGLAYAAGVRPGDLIRRHPGRFELMHVKDEQIKPGGGERGQGYESVVLGTGQVKLEEIVQLGRSMGGTRYFITEQESFQGMPELECARKDFLFMRNLPIAWARL